MFGGPRPWAALLGTVLFLPYAAVSVPVFQGLPVLGVSAGYVPVPVLIVIYAVLLRRRAPALARGFVFGAGLLLVSLMARSVDETLCAQVPIGTHFLWHLLNAAMLGWMIEVYARHIRARTLEGAGRAR